MKMVRPGAEAGPVDQGLSYPTYSLPMLGLSQEALGRGAPTYPPRVGGGVSAFPFHWFPPAPPQEAAAKGLQGTHILPHNGEVNIVGVRTLVGA